MPWQEVSVVSLRTEFVTFAQREGANISELCRRFGISRKTGHKWLKRSKTHLGCLPWRTVADVPGGCLFEPPKRSKTRSYGSEMPTLCGVRGSSVVGCRT